LIKPSTFQRTAIIISVSVHLLLLLALSSLYDPHGMRWQWPWVPSLGVSFSIQLDGLSMLFSWLICGIGFLVQLYAYHYMRGKPSSALFHIYLTLFMMAMLGLVLAGNILILFIFWELTTLTSYLLIGFNHDQQISRKNALQAILVTGAGGLALLAGLILLGGMAGSYELDHIIKNIHLIKTSNLFLPTLVLILVGAFTKSAQIPFHFWLPGAMSAPAPVSAYLHSATMVKAGVYLLARLSPVFSHSDLWFWSLIIVGGATAVWTGILALKQKDLKLMLAYSTNVALGKLMFLLAFGNRYAIAAALMFIIAHALYKAALFMVIGTVDKAAGTRDYRYLAGLGGILKLSFIAAGLSALSKSGIPPFPGFLSKEYMYKAALSVSYVPTAILVIVNSIMAALAFIIVIKPFLAHPDENCVPLKAVEKYTFLWLPPLCLGFIGLFTTVFGLEWLNTTLIGPASIAVNPGLETEPLKLWQGINQPLILGGVSLLLGVMIYRYHDAVSGFIDQVTRRLPSGDDCFEGVINMISRLASWQTGILQHGRLADYMFLLFSMLGFLLIWYAPALPVPDTIDFHGISLHEVILAVFLLAAVITLLLSSSSLMGIFLLGTVGFITTLFLMFYNAPDVAKTQLLVETLTVIFLVMVVRRLPGFADAATHSAVRRAVNAGVSLSVGVGVFWTLYSITSGTMDTRLTDYFAANSVIAAHGRNMVNVILVDFRALDTLGEISVVVMAALGASTLLNKRKRRNG